jgi:HSP20 family protein
MILRDPMSQFFEESFWDPFERLRVNPFHLLEWQSPVSQYVPGVDMAETDKEIQVIADVPGYDPKDIEVTLENSVLTIKGRMEEDKEEKGKKWYHRQCASGNFFQQFHLPAGLDESGVKCKVKHGKLTITIPKKTPSKASKVVPIDVEG